MRDELHGRGSYPFSPEPPEEPDQPRPLGSDYVADDHPIDEEDVSTPQSRVTDEVEL